MQIMLLSVSFLGEYRIMKKKRLDRNLKWGFQFFPYYQMRVDMEEFHGLACLIRMTDGDIIHWTLPRAGRVPVAGSGMVWLELIPDGQHRMITAKYLPEKRVSLWYVDVMESFEFDSDGVAVYEDKYLDVYFTPQGDVVTDDRDELDAAFRSGELTRAQYEAALEEGEAILKELCTDISATEAWCGRILACVEERIAGGLLPMEKDPAVLGMPR